MNGERKIIIFPKIKQEKLLNDFLVDRGGPVIHKWILSGNKTLKEYSQQCKKCGKIKIVNLE